MPAKGDTGYHWHRWTPPRRRAKLMHQGWRRADVTLQQFLTRPTNRTYSPPVTSTGTTVGMPLAAFKSCGIGMRSGGFRGGRATVYYMTGSSAVFESTIRAPPPSMFGPSTGTIAHRYLSANERLRYMSCWKPPAILVAMGQTLARNRNLPVSRA